MCPLCQDPAARVVRCGFFAKSSTRAEKIQRFLCRSCERRFSSQTGTLTYRERKPHLTQHTFRLLGEGVSRRGCARVLHVHRTTIARKLVRTGRKAKANLDAANQRGDIGEVVMFDEMETFEHSKCKPLSIAVAVDKVTRRVIAVEVASMPAKGRLAAIARKRYGFRPDQRRAALTRALSTVHNAAPRLREVHSDRCPRYQRLVRRHLPNARHVTSLSRRACVVGQGEMKRGGFDPLFSLNHTCAMFRDRVKTLSRRTWCTTKKASMLQHVLYLYAWLHNERLRTGSACVSV